MWYMLGRSTMAVTFESMWIVRFVLIKPRPEKTSAYSLTICSALALTKPVLVVVSIWLIQIIRFDCLMSGLTRRLVCVSA